MTRRILALLLFVTPTIAQPINLEPLPPVTQDNQQATTTQQPDAAEGTHPLEQLLQQAVPLLQAEKPDPSALLRVISEAEQHAEKSTSPREKLIAETIRIAGYFTLAEAAREQRLTSVASFRLAQARGVAARLTNLNQPEAEAIRQHWKLLLELSEVSLHEGSRGDLLATLVSYLTRESSQWTSDRTSGFEREVRQLGVAMQLEQGHVIPAADLVERKPADQPLDAQEQTVIRLSQHLNTRIPGSLLRAIDYRDNRADQPVRALALIPWGQELDPESLRTLKHLQKQRTLTPLESRIIIVGGTTQPPIIPGWTGPQAWIPGSEVSQLQELGIQGLPCYLVVDPEGKLITLGYGPLTLNRALRAAEKFSSATLDSSTNRSEDRSRPVDMSAGEVFDPAVAE